MKKLTLSVFAATILLPSTLLIAEEGVKDDVVVMEGMRIRGNQEQPTVLYLVPWQPPEVKKLTQPEANIAFGQETKPLKRSEFQRWLGYQQWFEEDQ